MPRSIDRSARVSSALLRRVQIERHNYKDFTGGWRPDKPLSRLAPNEMSDVKNLEFERGGGVRKRGGFEEYTDSVTDLDNIEFMFAPPVYTVSGLQPIYAQKVFVMNTADSSIYYANFGQLEIEFQSDGDGSDLVDSGQSLGPVGSAGSSNYFRKWPLQVVTWEDKIYMTGLRFAGFSGGSGAGGTWETENGMSTGASKALKYDAQNDSFSRPDVARLDQGDTSAFPRARCCIAYYDRIFAANVHSQGNFRYASRVYWSDAGEAETWDVNSWIAVGADDGTEITALLPLGSQILIFKNHSLYSLVGTDEDTFALYPISPELGSEGTFSVTTYEGVAYFFDVRTMNVWTYDGAEIQKIGDPVSEYIRNNINYNAAFKVNVQTFSNQLWLSFPKGDVTANEDDENTETLVYDLDVGAWTRWDFGIVPAAWPRYTDYDTDSGGATIEGDSNPYYVISDSTQDNHIMKGYQGETDADADMVWQDNGSNYTFQFRTGWFSPDEGMERKRLRRLEFVTAENSDQIDVVLYRDFINSSWQSFNFDPLADTSPDLLEYHLQTSVIDAIGLFNWLAFDVQATHANEAQVNSINVRYSFRPSPRGDIGGSQYHE